MDVGADKLFGDIPETLGAMAVLGAEGDIKYTWDKTNKTEVEAAREQFNNLRSKGFLAFKIRGKLRERKGDGVIDFDSKAGRYQFMAPPTEKITEFDPEAKRVVLTPPVGGG